MAVAKEMIRCPFCYEPVAAQAIKCKHCLSELPVKKKKTGFAESSDSIFVHARRTKVHMLYGLAKFDEIFNRFPFYAGRRRAFNLAINITKARHVWQ